MEHYSPGLRELDMPRFKGSRLTCIVLNEDSEEPLDGSEDSPVDHDGLLFCAVRVNVRHVKALRQVEVQLHCRALPFAANRISHLFTREIQLTK